MMVSPNSAKIKNVNAARKIKNGSPKIRETLRQKFRQRMHERREQIFVMRRHGMTDYSQEVKNALTDIVHEEFDNIAAMEWFNSPEEQRQQQLMDLGVSRIDETFNEDETAEIEESTEEQWILEEYQRILWEQKQISSLFNEDVMCPICLKGLLHESPNCVTCRQCGLNLPMQFGLESLKQNIQEHVNTHSAACLDVPKFSVFRDGDNVSLCFSCASCDIFELV
ncbi:RPA-interacting protein-like [Copidosoma floridanum]|uniref:RPA-interacting protein-like n=1 Tax=Copidosoma floridanum TaxID=29053 RepID=UPI0006C977DF|nr:RPA-interacting protein-like [Copidosoma floridanum]